MGVIIPIMTSMVGVIPVIQGVMAVNNDLFDPTLDLNAERLAYKLQGYLRSKDGNLLPLITLNHKKDRYYWCILAKQFVLLNGNTELYLLPWKLTNKKECYVYCHYVFSQGAVLLIPEEEIIQVGFN
jgi:hypothetical protein